MKNDLIAIYVMDEEAKMFVEFQKYRELFSLLLSKGVFDIKSGSVALHFDHEGVLQSIQRADILYSKKFEKLSTV